MLWLQANTSTQNWNSFFFNIRTETATNGLPLTHDTTSRTCTAVTSGLCWFAPEPLFSKLRTILNNTVTVDKRAWLSITVDDPRVFFGGLASYPPPARVSVRTCTSLCLSHTLHVSPSIQFSCCSWHNAHSRRIWQTLWLYRTRYCAISERLQYDVSSMTVQMQPLSDTVSNSERPVNRVDRQRHQTLIGNSNQRPLVTRDETSNQWHDDIIHGLISRFSDRKPGSWYFFLKQPTGIQ